MTDLFDRVKAALADKYVVESELGEGGMATVYLASDPKLNRAVAIKVMHPDLALSLGKERFLREVQVTAQLSNPNILALYDSGEADGLLYYVMPFIEGETLSDLIAREQQLSVDDAIRITRDIAGALSYAHSHGVVHRDIKPSNILMAGDRAIVADFGVSRAFSEAGGEKLTKTGLAVGTPAYMSPEQAAGKIDVDGRSDVYSLGCILYEMLVGQIPFTGPTPMAIMARHSTDVVPPPSIMRQSIAPELESIIFCALAKVPADRFRTAKELDEALAAIEAGHAPKVRKSTYQHPAYRQPAWRRQLLPVLATLGVVALAVVAYRIFDPNRPPTAGSVGGFDAREVAVMYLQDRSSDGQLQFIADGLTEGLIDELSRVRTLSVASRNASAAFRGVVSRDSIAGALQVGSIIEGTVESIGDKLRVEAQLIDGNSGARFAEESLEWPRGELLTLQDSLVKTVAELVRRRIGERVTIRSQRAGTDNSDAWSIVQQAERERKSAEAMIREDDFGMALASFERSDSLLQVAEALDPDWVEPIVLRGEVAYRLSRYEAGAAAETLIDEAVGHANRALIKVPDELRAREIRGSANYWRVFLHRITNPAEEARVLASAREDLEAAAETLPRAGSTLSHLHQRNGDKTDAFVVARRAYVADAYLDQANAVLLRLYSTSFDLNELSQAKRWCDEGWRRYPYDERFVLCQLSLMSTEAIAPDVDSAWTLLSKVDELAPPPTREFAVRQGRMAVAAVIAAERSAPDSALSVVASARADSHLDPSGVLLLDEARVLVLLQEYDGAIDVLKRFLAVNPEQDHASGEEGRVLWWWEPLRSHQRYGELTSASH